jgi:hypothetical protein
LRKEQFSWRERLKEEQHGMEQRNKKVEGGEHQAIEKETVDLGFRNKRELQRATTRLREGTFRDVDRGIFRRDKQ